MAEYIGALEIMKFTNKHWFAIGLIMIVACLTMAFLDTKTTYLTQEPSVPNFGKIDVVAHTQDLNTTTKEDINLSDYLVVLGTPIWEGLK